MYLIIDIFYIFTKEFIFRMSKSKIFISTITFLGIFSFPFLLKSMEVDEILRCPIPGRVLNDQELRQLISDIEARNIVRRQLASKVSEIRDEVRQDVDRIKFFLEEYRGRTRLSS